MKQLDDNMIDLIGAFQDYKRVGPSRTKELIERAQSDEKLGNSISR